jgi:hypothetical protein
MTAEEQAEYDARQIAEAAKEPDRAQVRDDPKTEEILDALLALAPADITVDEIKTRRQAARDARARLNGA